jgi:hypothetical protein
MAFEELRERIQSESKAQWESFQQSSLYIQVKERYENLTPVMQKVTLVGFSLFFAYLVLSIPLGYYSQSSTYVSEFEEKRQLIRDLLKSSREAQESPNLAIPPSVDSLKAQIETQIQSAKLLPEQNAGTEILGEKPKMIPGNLSQGVLRVQLKKLNVRQILDLGHQFQTVNSSVKMTDLVMQANPEDPRYFDVSYKLAVLAVPSQIESAPEPEAPPKRRGR